MPGAVDQRGFEWHYLNRICLRPRVVGHVDWHGLSPGRLLNTDDWKRILNHSVVHKDDREIRYRLVVTDVETNTEVWSTEVTRPVVDDKTPKGAAYMSPNGAAVCFYHWMPFESQIDRLLIDMWNIESGKHQLIELHDIRGTPFPTGNNNFYLEPYFNPGGRYFALEHQSDGPADTTILVVWEVGNTEPLHSTELAVPLQNPRRLGFSPDGSRLAIVSTRMTVTPDERLAGHGKLLILDTVTGKQLATSSLEPNYWASFPVFSPDGSLIASTGHNRTESEFRTKGALFIWDAKTGLRLRTISLKSTVLFSPVRFSPDSKMVCILPSGELIEARSGASVGQLSIDQNARSMLHGSCVKFTPNSRSIVAVRENGDRLQWDVPSPRFHHPAFLQGGHSFESTDGTHVGRMSWMPELSGASLNILNIDGTNRPMDIPAEISRNGSIHAFSHDCRLVALTIERADDLSEQPDDSDQTPKTTKCEVTLWEVETGKQVGTLWSPKEHEQIVVVRSVPKRGLMVGMILRQPPDAAPSYQLQIWDLSTLTTTTTVDLAHFHGIEFSHDGQTVAVESVEENKAKSQLTLYRIDDGTQLAKFPISHTVLPNNSLIYNWAHRQRLLQFSRDGSAIAALCHDEDRIDIWDVQTGKRRQSLHGIASYSPFTWSASGDRIIAFESNTRGPGQLKVWDTRSGKRLLVHADHGVVQNALRLLPDGQRIVGWSKLGPPRIWDATSRDED